MVSRTLLPVQIPLLLRTAYSALVGASFDLFARFPAALSRHTRWRIRNLACRFAFHSDRDFFLFRLNVFAVLALSRFAEGETVRWYSVRHGAVQSAFHSNTRRKWQCLANRPRNRPARPVCHGSTDTPRALITQTNHADSLSRSIYTPANTITCSSTTTTNGFPFAICTPARTAPAQTWSAVLFPISA